MPLQPNFKPGDPWGAKTVNELIREKNAPLKIKPGPGINVRAADEGQVQIYLSRAIPFVFKGKVHTGGITARTSDTTHGTGKVDVWARNASTGLYASTGVTVNVDYISSTTGGLAAGVWVNCMVREDGGAEIISVDCAN